MNEPSGETKHQTPLPNKHHDSFNISYYQPRIRKAALLLVIIVGIWYFLNKGIDFSKLLDLSPAKIGMSSIAILSSYFVSGLRMSRLFHPFGLQINFSKWLNLFLIQQLGNLIFFKAGTITVAHYLKNNHNLTYTKFILGMTLDKVFLLIALGIFGAFIGFSSTLQTSLNTILAMISILLLTVLNISLFIKWRFRPSRNTWLFRKITRALDHFSEYQTQRENLIKLICCHILVILSFAYRFYIGFVLLNIHASFFQCVILSVSAFIMGFIGITPGSLGIREIAVGLVFSLLGKNFDHGVFAVAIDRLISSLLSCSLGFFAFNSLHLKEFQKKAESLSI